MKRIIALFLLATLLLALAACSGGAIELGAPPVSAAQPGTASTEQDSAASRAQATTETDSIIRPEGWREESHGSDAEPDYELIFPDDEVKQMTITIAAEDWAAMQANMVELFGEAGSGEDGRNAPSGGERPEGEVPQPGAEGLPGEFRPPDGGERPAMPGDRPGGRGPGGGDLTPENPMWVPATIEFEGQTWTHVGVRFKGNSSLTSGWRSGSPKLPLKLDFDEFEDEYPEIDDQRFYGFKQLSLANGFSDPSFLHDAAASAILQEAGLPAAETAFYEVILDYGEGPVSLGLYTLIEVVDDTVVDRYFGSDDGNIYEAEGSAASFAAATYDRIEDSFQKENNKEEADWNDIEALFEVLHDDQRTSDPAAWRADLESIFDVDAFLEWLAIAAVIQHWDAYGSMSHNYYLYHDPDTDQLEWISWDHNMALSAGQDSRGVRGGPGPGDRSVSLDKADIDEHWPLIRFLLDDPVYYALYVDYLAETVDGPFNPDHMVEAYEAWAELIAPYAIADVGEATFDAAVQQLIDGAYQRAEAVQAFLSSHDD
ncbi:MAG: CotH kinase family protein [Anaerolineae bacterium]|jgi:hypothetical protein